MRFRPFSIISALAFLVLGTIAYSGVAVNAAQATATLVPVQSVPTTCPDASKPIVTATATLVQSPTPTATGTPQPRIVVSAGLFNVTQPPPLDIIQQILEFDPGVVSNFYQFPEQVILIVLQGQLTYCSGNYQRLLLTDESWTVNSGFSFRLANTGGAIARVSMTRVRPIQATVQGTLGATTAPTQAVTVVPITATQPSTATLVATAIQPVTATQPVTPTLVGTAAGTQAAAGYLGIRVAAVNGNGLRIMEIFANSPAQAAQLQVNDVITAINGQALADIMGGTPSANSDFELVQTFFRRIEQTPPGTQLTLGVQRGNQTLNVAVIVGVKPPGQ